MVRTAKANGQTVMRLGNIPMSVAKGASSSTGAGLKAPPRLELPKVKIGKSAIEDAKAILMAAKNGATSRGDWMRTIGLPQRAAIDAAVEEAGEDYLDVIVTVGDNVDGEEVEVEMTMGQVRENFDASINSYLNWGDNGEEPNDKISRKEIRRAAHAALINFQLSQVTNLQELHALMAEFYKKGYIEEAEAGEIKGPGGKDCTLAVDERYGDLGKDATIVKQVTEIISKLAIRFRVEFSTAAKDKERELRDTSETSVTDLCNGDVVGNGKIALKILSEGSFRQDGTIQVQLDEDGRITPIEGSGNLAQAMAQFRSMKIFVTLEQLFDENGKLLEKPPYFTSKQRLSEDEFKKFIGCRVKFWHWVRQGVSNGKKWLEKEARRTRAKEEKEALLQKMQEDLGTANTVPSENWLLQKEPGDSILIVRDWEDGDISFEFLVVKLRREIEREEHFLSFVGTTPEVGDYFTASHGKRYADNKDRFEGIDDPRLRRFLRAAWGQANKKTHQ